MPLAKLLHSTFGFPVFRVNQEAVCRAATDGRDVLLVMPTGAGKSLCYQLPTIARGGTGLVVSPLIALMEDQAAKLATAGLRVARIHSGLSRDESRQACRDYLDGKLQFLFIAPERMRVQGFPEMLARRKPSLIAIDEAHCISAWGHDFRPDYRLLGEYLPALRPAPIIALTATATPAVQKDIVNQLNLQDPALFIHGFRRENLAIEVVELSKPRRAQFTVDFLRTKERRPAIVYAPSRKAAEELAGELGRHFPAAAYHAGLDSSVRERVQRHFQSGKLEVVVATIAFGMGIDKADVRTVVHYALPASVEAYYQEIGRAGRDGLPSRTILLYSFVDRKIHDTFLERDYPPASELMRVAVALTDDYLMPDFLAAKLRMDREVVTKVVDKLASQGAAQIDMAGNVRRSGNASWQTGYQQQVEFRRSQIERMMQFAEAQQCRMSALIRHFGDTADAHRPCGHCDFCAPGSTSAQTFVEPTAAQERDLGSILRALDGGMAKSTGRLHTGLALTSDRKIFDGLLDGLARAGLIALNSETFTNADGKVIPYKKACLTHEGRTRSAQAPLGVLLHAETGAKTSGKGSRKSKSDRKTAASVTHSGYTARQKELEGKLREWRTAEAAKTGKPAFLVFADSALDALVHASPANLSALSRISGFGGKKLEAYGASLCALCREEGRAASEPAVEKSTSKGSCSAARKEPMDGPNKLSDDALPPPERRRPRTQVDPANTLNADQQALEHRLREWRKAESEKMGLPQFFVLGTSTLRSIVLTRPRTLTQLERVDGIGSEKLDRFGASILAVCNA